MLSNVKTPHSLHNINNVVNNDNAINFAMKKNVAMQIFHCDRNFLTTFSKLPEHRFKSQELNIFLMFDGFDEKIVHSTKQKLPGHGRNSSMQ